MEAMQGTGNLISSEKIEGTNVYKRTGDTLGSIHDLMIDKTSGHVVYAIMSFGGFLGVGKSISPSSVVGPEVRHEHGWIRRQSRQTAAGGRAGV
jgi:sporulation protein YlmC with PRC-barrel domain